MGLQEFVSLLGMEEKCQGSSAMQFESMAEEGCQVVACPCCSRQSHGDSKSCSPDGLLQQQHKEANMTAAVECILREIGEDPDREVNDCLKPFSSILPLNDFAAVLPALMLSQCSIDAK